MAHAAVRRATAHHADAHVGVVEEVEAVRVQPVVNEDAVGVRRPLRYLSYFRYTSYLPLGPLDTYHI